MKKENLYEPFSISFETIDEYSKAARRNTFFELIYILSGSGTKEINGYQFSYSEGNLFLLTPSDYYLFDIESKTQFFFLRFNDIYIKNNPILTENFHNLSAMLQDAKHLPGCILKNEADNAVIKQMIEIMIRECPNNRYYKELVQQFVNTIIIIVAINIAQFSPLKIEQDTDDKTLSILRYIQKNIYYPEKILAGSISDHFKISIAHLGRYFKKHTAETMQQYIINYKTKLIENQLIFSDKRINEIADEFGFSDVSHLNKFFRKQKGKNPTEFRKTSRG